MQLERPALLWDADVNWRCHLELHLRGFKLLHQQADLAAPLGKFLQLHGPWREEVHGQGDLACQVTGQLEPTGGEALRLGVA